ncbi:MAG: response regulator transcription factor [Jeotgalicoccus sp.]|nr:response regulator transcription factor [Jeotgalicoccus sp.]
MNEQVTILIIEDDPSIVELLKLYLQQADYRIILASDGEDGLEKYYNENPDCILLDLMLPKMDGIELCRMIRLDDSATPLIMLTGKGENYDIIKGLDTGADDYVVKPFNPNELMARIKSVLRRSDRTQDDNNILKIYGMTVILNEHRLIINQAEYFLAPKEIELLHYLISFPNQILSRQQILDNVWGTGFEGDNRTLDVHIKRLRDKLLDAGANISIKTIRGIGYRLEADEHEE